MVDSPFNFNPVPKAYDEVMGPVYFEAYAVETALRVASWNPASVLETACGTGRVTGHLRKKIAGTARLVATDINKEMLSYAKQKFAEVRNIEWQEADALHLPFENDSFDTVVCQFGAMFFPDKKKGFAEAYRVLKAGGNFIFVVWEKLHLNPLGAAGREVLNDFFNGRPPENLRTAFSMTDQELISGLLAEAGFGSIEMESITKPCETESAEKFAEAFVEGSSVREAVRKFNPGEVKALQKKICETWIGQFGNHPVKSTMQAIVCTASKGS